MGAFRAFQHNYNCMLTEKPENTLNSIQDWTHAYFADFQLIWNAQLIVFQDSDQRHDIWQHCTLSYCEQVLLAHRRFGARSITTVHAIIILATLICCSWLLIERDQYIRQLRRGYTKLFLSMETPHIDRRMCPNFRKPQWSVNFN